MKLAGAGPSLMSFDGMVAAAHPIAARCGAGILAGGGNAFDAAVAVASTLGVVEPFMSGLAGMGSATMWVAAERRVRVLDFVPPLPASFPVERFASRSDLARGPMSVGSPGNLAGWSALSRRYGRLPWHAVLEPAATVAERGFALAEFGATEIATHLPDLRAQTELWPEWCDTYPFAEGVRFGQRVRQPALANTLRQIGAEGPECFYRGALGEKLVSHLSQRGGCLTMDDLAAVAANWVEPISAAYRGYEINLPPPPCEGFQILLALRILDGVPPDDDPGSEAVHLDRVIRAIRLAAGERIASNNPGAAELARLLSSEHVQALQRRLAAGDGLHGPVEQWMREPASTPDFAHTTSFSVADGEGNLVCITQSLGTAFGSGVVVPGTGISLNNFMHWADVQPDSPNRSRPGDALPMCMAPCIATRDGEPVLAIGTPGGYGILQTTVQTLTRHIGDGLPLQAAIDAPRMRLWDGNDVQLEDRFSPALIAQLREKGHGARSVGTGWTMLVGGMQAVLIDPATGLQTGAADPRRDGYVVPI